MKRLLITSDDFGMCHSVNRGTVRAMTEGIVQTTNLMAPCPWFEDAVEATRRHSLDVGVHLCATCDWDRMKWRPLTGASCLTGIDGCFLHSHEALADRAAQAPSFWDELTCEWRAQIALVRARGISPTHLSTHMLSSASPGEYAERARVVAASLAEEFSVPFTYERIGPRGALGLAQQAADAPLRHFQAELEISSHPKTDVLETIGGWTAPGTYHLIGHAAEPSPELSALCSPEHPSRRWADVYRPLDLEWFTDSAVRARLADLGFELIRPGALDA